MSFVVEFETGPAPGRRVRVTAEQPRSLRVLDHGDEAGHIVFEVHDDGLRVLNHSSRPLLIGGQPANDGLLQVGDRLTIGRDTAVVLADDGSHREPTTDSQRRRRAITAEGTAARSDSQRQGLVARVSTALTTRAERGREEELQRQRQDLLAQVGRRALDGERFGIPPAAIQALLTGKAVRLEPSAVDREALDWWRQARDRLGLMDAEIAILRKVIGLGLDPGARPAPIVRQELRQQEQRTFEALDGEPTQQELDPLPASAEATTSASSRQRAAPLRRRRA
jgi:hypothetical protein